MFKLIFNSIIFFLITTSSFAYLGPGVGGGVIAATIGIIVAIFAALFAILWFPIKRIYYRFFKNKKKREEDLTQK